MARRSDEIVHLKLRFPEGLRRRISSAAKANNRSMNAEIMHQLLQAYANQDLGPGPAADRFTRAMKKLWGLPDNIADVVGTTKPEESDK
jgi:hypothetical protein